MEIEEILLEYFKATNKNCSYTIENVKELPNSPMPVTPVVINGRHICFWEVSDHDTAIYIIYWAFTQGDKFEYLEL